MLAGVSSTNRMTCLSVSMLIVVVTMNVEALDFAQFQERRFKIEFVYGCAQSVEPGPVNGARCSVAENGERFRGVGIARLEQFPKASSRGRGLASVELSIRFTSRSIGDAVR